MLNVAKRALQGRAPASSVALMVIKLCVVQARAVSGSHTPNPIGISSLALPFQDPHQPKPRRIRIQFEDDDDVDHAEGRNNGDRNTGSSTSTALKNEGRSEKKVGSPAADKPQYRVCK